MRSTTPTREGSSPGCSLSTKAAGYGCRQSEGTLRSRRSEREDNARGGFSTFRVCNDYQLAFVRKYDVEASASRRLFWGSSRYVDSSNSGESLRTAKH